MRQYVYFILFILTINQLITVSCKNDLIKMEANILDRATDTTSPVLTLETPIENSIYDQTITISGSITDDGMEMPIISYTLSDYLGVKTITGSVDITKSESKSGSSGTFSFDLSTTQFDTDIIISLEAADWNENSSEPIIIKLTYPGSTIPSLSVSPGNNEILINWDTISGAEDYTIYYNTKGTPFAESLAQTLSYTSEELLTASPITLNSTDHGVRNGILCQIRVTASDSEGNTWSSSLMDTVPLSQFSLIPKTETYGHQIYLTWKAVKVPEQKSVTYEVWRSTNGEEGNYILISDELLTESYFMDTSVAAGTIYYYKISVIENDQMTSSPVPAQCPQMFNQLSTEMNRFLNEENLIRVETDGNDSAFALRLVKEENYDVDVEVIALDISDLSSIRELSRDDGDLELVKKTASSIYAYDIALSDDRVYVGINYQDPSSNNQYRILSFDISNPSGIQNKPTETIDPNDDHPNTLLVDSSNDRLYIGLDGTDNTLGQVDISVPANPGPIVKSSAVTGEPVDISYSGSYTYLLTKNPAELITLDCSGATPLIVDTIVLTDSSNYAAASGIFDDMQAIDIDNDAAKLILVSMTNSEDGDYYHGGVWVYDISDVTAPDFDGGFDAGLPLVDTQVGGGYALCAGYNGRVKMMGYSDPASIYERTEFDTIGSSPGLCLSDNGIIVADGSAGLMSIITDTREVFSIVKEDNSLSQSYDSFLKGDKLYLAQRYGVSAYQLNSSGNFYRLNYQSMNSNAVVVLGNYALYATDSNSNGELAVISLSSNGDVSATPSYIAGESNSSDIDYWGDYIYLAEENAGVEVFRISDPENIESVVQIPVNRRASKVIALDDYLYIADYAYGLLCYNISDPENPVYLGDFYDTSSSERGISSISSTKDYILFSFDTGTFILPARPGGNWTEATSTSLGSALSKINKYSNSTNVEGDTLYMLKSQKLYTYNLKIPEAPQATYISRNNLVDTNEETIELYGNYVIIHNHYDLYSIQINQ